MSSFRVVLIFFAILFASQEGIAQHFLSTSGKAIVNENQDTILLRGMGLGGWMVQEGYMLQTDEFANPQHKIRSTIEALIGSDDTDLFYEAWLNNHVRKADIDSLKKWGFNSVRLPMHYNLFTLPIEQEPISGQDTWLEKGFELTDQLIAWCKENEMYVILDMHATPGGQGYDEGISDYDPTKPSLWESNENKRKLVALWTRIADRYAEEEWVAGYDLINEPNWNLPSGTALRLLYEDLTNSIRAVDNRHILFIEGNWFANDFTGLTPPWDDNFVYSPHKYWSTNDVATMQWALDLREQYNVPLYLGESGENSNVWFRDAIALLEGLDIGWAWWPMKKVESIAGPLSVIKTSEYQSLLDYWKGNGVKPSAEFARNALMDLAEKLKTENCIYQKDVIDAMFRQVHSNETKPFAAHSIPGIVHASDYDLGVIGEAYYDVQAANYNVSLGVYTSWNDGWQYRNDGVDIELSENTINANGYNVGFMDAGEWMQYEIDVEESGVYEAHVRGAAEGSGGFFHFSMDGGDVTSSEFIGQTGGWQDWNTVVVSNIILNEDDKKLRFHVDGSGFNVASFEFVKTALNSEDVSTVFVSAHTFDEMTVHLNVNKRINNSNSIDDSNFELTVDGNPVPINSVSLDGENSRILKISLDYTMDSRESIRVSYVGPGITAIDGTSLQDFSLEPVRNTLDFIHEIPGKIEAEDFSNQVGIALENTSDNGGGENIGFLDVNDFIDYEVNISEAANYSIDYRTAAEFGTGGLQLQLIDQNGSVSIVDNPSFSSTGGWQNWSTTTRTVSLPKGQYLMRVLITQAPFNLNWMSFRLSTSLNELGNEISFIQLKPNVSSHTIVLDAQLKEQQNVEINVFDLIGNLLFKKELTNQININEVIPIKSFSQGQYILKLDTESGATYTERFVKI